MKTRLLVVLFGLFSLFGSTAVLAHNPGHWGAHAGIPLTGGITIWGDSYGHTGYAGNVGLGFVGGYANDGYAVVPHYGYAYGPAYGYAHSYGYTGGYRHGYRHGRSYGHYRNRHQGYYRSNYRGNHLGNQH